MYCSLWPCRISYLVLFIVSMYDHIKWYVVSHIEHCIFSCHLLQYAGVDHQSMLINCKNRQALHLSDIHILDNLCLPIFIIMSCHSPTSAPYWQTLIQSNMYQYFTLGWIYIMFWVWLFVGMHLLCIQMLKNEKLAWNRKISCCHTPNSHLIVWRFFRLCFCLCCC